MRWEDRQRSEPCAPSIAIAALVIGTFLSSFASKGASGAPPAPLGESPPSVPGLAPPAPIEGEHSGAEGGGAVRTGSTSSITPPMEPLVDEPDDETTAPASFLSPSTLPPVEPDPDVAPMIEGRDDTIAPPILPSERPEVVIKTILGLLLLLALAYLGGHASVQEWERKLGISQVITAGFPFVLLGMIARFPAVGVLSDSVLAELSPLLRVALGWLGFVIGFRFDARLFSGLPAGTARVIGLTTSIPFAFVVGTSAVLLFLFSGSTRAAIHDPVFVRDALTLGTAGAMTAHTTTQIFASGKSGETLSRILRLEELAGMMGLAVIAAYFRPQGADVTWQLPGTAWLFLTLGLGAMVGAVVYAVLERAHDGPEFVVVTLGSISFAAGIAGYLLLSPVVVSFLAALLLANFPGSYKERLAKTLQRLERPIYLVSLVAVGALWKVDEWRGWVLIPVFMATRLAGKWIGTHLTLHRTNLDLTPVQQNALAIAPMGPLAIAIVINAQLLYPGGSISQIVSAVIGGAILTEIVVQLVRRKTMPRSTPLAGQGPRERAE